MRGYRPSDLSAEARRIAETQATDRTLEGGLWTQVRARVPDPASIDARKGKKPASIKVQTPTRVLFGTEELDLGSLEQLVEEAQVRAIARALIYASGRWIDGRRTLHEALAGLIEEIAKNGLAAIDARQPGDLAAFRIHELAAALSRLRSLRVHSRQEETED